MLTRRHFLLPAASVAALAAAGSLALFGGALGETSEGFEVTKSDAEWRAILTPDQYAVLRQEATEPPWSSPLNDEKRKGTFHCAGCDLALFSSDTKFDSGTSWPSFWQEIEGAVGYKEDRSLFMLRIEEHCSRCGGHLGHVFDDGPPPTGKRHCINGLALTFRPATAGATG
jgi:peptide-methionine (R)-S-oxide reductase